MTLHLAGVLLALVFVRGGLATLRNPQPGARSGSRASVCPKNVAVLGGLMALTVAVR